jgi:hypothetical protein
VSAEPNDRGWLWFGGWAAIGAGFGLALAALLSIGLFIAPVVALAALLLARRSGSAVGLPGLLAGPAVPLLLIAWFNRGGPGTVCTGFSGGGSGQECTDEWNPVLFLVPAAVLLLTSVLLFLALRRQFGRRPGLPV